MSVSKCPNCGKGVLQVDSVTPAGANREILCIICHGCNSVVGTLEHASDEKFQQETNLQIELLNNKLDTINRNIGQMMNGVKLLYNKLEESNKS